MKNKFNLDKLNIPDFLKTPRGKGIVFLGAYFILFMFLFISMSVNDVDEGKTPVMNLRLNKIIASFNSIENNNYQYNYIINDDSIHIIQGKRYNNKEVFTMMNNSVLSTYQYDGMIMAKQEGDKYYQVESVYLNKDFFDIKSIKMILKNSVFYDEIKYSDEKFSYTYQISLADLMDLFEIEIVDSKDKITITVDYENGVTNRIQLDVTPYQKYYDESINKYTIELNYSHYGEVQDFELNGVVE